MLKPIRPIPQIPMSMSSLPSVAQHATLVSTLRPGGLRLSACYALRARLSARRLPPVGGFQPVVPGRRHKLRLAPADLFGDFEHVRDLFWRRSEVDETDAQAR